MLPSSILLIKLRHHGDVLLATPVARALRAHFPHCPIDMLVYEGTEPLIKTNPDLRHIWTWSKSGGSWSNLMKQLVLFWQLWRQKYSMVIHLSDQMQGAFLARLLASEVSVGIDYPKRRYFFWKHCFTKLAPHFLSDTRHTVEQNLVTLECLGIHPLGEHKYCRLVVAPLDRETIQARLTQAKITTPYIVIHPAARWFFKCWEDDRFATVITYFSEQGWPIVITSSEEAEEKEMIVSILERVASLKKAAGSLKESAPILSLAGELTLGQLAALIEGATLFVGVDSVPMHIAAALEKKSVALFGSSKVQEWHPWCTSSYCLIKASDYGQVVAPDAVQTNTKERYLSSIPVEPVIAAIASFLAPAKEEKE